MASLFVATDYLVGAPVPSARWPTFGDFVYAMWTFFGEIRVSGHAEGNMHNAHSGPPLRAWWGRGRCLCGASGFGVGPLRRERDFRLRLDSSIELCSCL